MNGFGRIGLTSPRTKRGMGDMGLAVMVQRSRLIRGTHKTGRCAEREHHVQDQSSGSKRGKPAPHLAPSSTWRINATEAVLSHSRGPTARPIGWPFGAMSTVVGKPRTMKERDSS